MNFRHAAVAVMFLSASTMYAETISVQLGQSSQNYTLVGTGGANGYGTYLNQPGDCSAGTSITTCTLSGSYTGSTTGYSSGTYILTTQYDNSDQGIPSTSMDPVDSPDGGNFFTIPLPLAADVQSSLILEDIAGPETVPLLVNGVFQADSYLIYPVDPMCANLPMNVPCTQGDVGLYKGDEIYGPVTGDLIFNVPSAVPEPEWLAFGGVVPGILVMLRRRFTTTS